MGETGSVMPQAAPPAPTAPAVKQKPKGAIGIWIGIVLILGGIVLGIVLVVSGAKSLLSGFDDLQRVPIAGGGVVRIEESGSQTIYAERPSSGSNTSFSSSTFSGTGPNVAVRVIGPGGEDVTVNTSVARETYTYDGREGVSIGTFPASTPGTYRVVSQLQDGSGWTTIAVGSALELSGIGAILGGVFGGGLIVLIGIIVVIIFAVRRSRSKKRLIQGDSPYPGAYGGPGGSWPAAPGYPAPGVAGGYGTPPAPGGYGTPAAPGGYGAPAAPGGWPAQTDNPGWAPPPVVQPVPGTPGPAWTSPQSPPPQAPPAPPSDASWQPPASATPPAPAAPPAAPPWQPGAEAPTTPAPAPADPLAPSWDPPATTDAPPPPPPSGDGGSAS
jgi:hypothetical protein